MLGAAEGKASMRSRVVALVMSGVLLAGCSARPETPMPAAPPIGAPSAYAAELFARTNDERAALGLPELERSECAERAATGRAEALVGAGELVHAPMVSLLEECVVDRAAENLVRSAAPPADVVAAWMDSPGHRNNIVDPDLTGLGIGCVPDGAELVCSQIYLQVGG